MEIRFRNKKVRELCECEAVARKKLGAECARKLRARLGDLQAAQSVTDLVAGNPHRLTGDLAGQYAVNLAGGWRLTFTPANDPVPCHADGGIDWRVVTIVCIEYIGDYHD
ncbi:type II toxin-antitoxin system RelE/ParE family toxin [Methylococcus geothermalis]|uniref:Killer suppression protein HigA n=1 Tax=Methylococcus geothermalis TaxID=2681310 RepID=A0A858Q5I5_9GAMM|nr:killer suppression protein HigA [Methylococcus geothermalis]QJD29064.1 killer suppression protein HigA [Methylococcus geothermalis]